MFVPLNCSISYMKYNTYLTYVNDILNIMYTMNVIKYCLINTHSYTHA